MNGSSRTNSIFVYARAADKAIQNIATIQASSGIIRGIPVNLAETTISGACANRGG
jgi:hypothetical protein